jgi:prepilin-type N-terminal cleavage/methylation domain-containing protein
MKTTRYFQTAAARRSLALSKGFTLIEITLVIALLLGLIAVLFIGVTAYRDGSNKAQCLLIQTTCQKAVRSYENLNQLNNGATLTSKSLVVGPGLYAADPGASCPGGGALTYGDTIPLDGHAWVTCAYAGTGTVTDHVPTSTDGW